MLSMLPALCRARVRGLRRLSTWQVACLQTNADHPCVDSCPCFNENQPASWPAEFRVSEEVVNRYASRQPNPLRMEEVLQMKDPEETAKMLMTEMPASSLVAECVDVAAQGDCRRCKQYVVLGMVVLEQILRPSIRLKCWHP
ncbi:unnamed protein product [Effrenium voratum]|nr:unnamed protein product [Effrenium voratum]